MFRVVRRLLIGRQYAVWCKTVLVAVVIIVVAIQELEEVPQRNLAIFVNLVGSIQLKREQTGVDIGCVATLKAGR